MQGNTPLIMCFDVETTGLPRGKAYTMPINISNFRFARVVQIAWIILDSNGRLLSKYCSLVRPSGWSTSRTTSVHGITDGMCLSDGIPIKVVLSLFSRALSTVNSVLGHNVTFDVFLVASELLRASMIEEHKALVNMNRLDTMAIKRVKLSNLYALHFPDSTFKAHDAMADTLACASIYFKTIITGEVTHESIRNSSSDSIPNDDSLINLSSIVCSDTPQLIGMSELVEDMRKNGMTAPISIIRVGTSSRYCIIDGMKRYKASVLLGNCKIKSVIIGSALGNELASMNLGLSNKIRSYSRLHEACGISAEDLCKELSIPESTLRRYLKIGRLPDPIIHMLDDVGPHKLTINTACKLSGIKAEYPVMKIIVDEVVKLSSNILQAKRISEIKLEMSANNNIYSAPFDYSVPWIYSADGTPKIIPEHKWKAIQSLLSENN